MDDDTMDRELARLARDVTDGDRELLDVPADLWSRIAATVSADRAGPAVPDSVDQPVAPVVGLDRARRRRALRLGGLAGVVAVAASLTLAVWLVGRQSGADRELAAVALSNEGLASFAVTPHGTARLLDDHGRLYLDLTVEDIPAVDADYLEIWLIDRNVEGMVSLGPYHGGGRYDVPVGVDPVTYPIVDVSVEPVDGIPTHSGKSVVRGVLPV